MEDFSDMTQPIQVINPDKEIQGRCLKIATLIKKYREDFVNQPDKSTYTTTVMDMAKVCFHRAIPLTVIHVLLPRTANLSQLLEQLRNLQRRTPRPKQSEKDIRLDIKKLIETNPTLIRNQDKNTLQKEFNICVQLVIQKQINNRDLAAYIEKARNLQEVRKMCVRAKDRRFIKRK